MNFPTVDSAENYIKGKVQAFFDNSKVLRDRLMLIGKLMQTAKARNDQPALGQLITLQQQTKDVFNEQLRLEQQLIPFAQHFGVNVTLGALPLVLGLAAVALAGAMYLQFEKIRTQGKALEMVSQGLLTPSEAAKITDSSLIGFGGGFGLAMPIVIGLGVLLIWSGALRR